MLDKCRILLKRVNILLGKDGLVKPDPCVKWNEMY